MNSSDTVRGGGKYGTDAALPIPKACAGLKQMYRIPKDPPPPPPAFLDCAPVSPIDFMPIFTATSIYDEGYTSCPRKHILSFYIFLGHSHDGIVSFTLTYLPSSG